MEDNNSTVFVQDNVVYNLSSIALVSNTNEVLNVIQPEIPNNAIFLTAEQLQSLGIQPNIILDQQPSPLQVEKPKQQKIIIKSPSTINNTVKVQKLQSVLINNQNPQKINESNNVNITKTVPIYKPIVVKPPEASNITHVIKKPVQTTGIKKKKVVKKKKIRVIKLDNLQKEGVSVEEQIAKQIEKVQKVVRTGPCETVVKKSNSNEKSSGKTDTLRQIEILDETAVTLKSVRTRAGRITKPPKHLKRDKEESSTSEIPNPTEPPLKQPSLSTDVLPNFQNQPTESLLRPINTPIKLEVESTNDFTSNLSEPLLSAIKTEEPKPLLSLPLKKEKRKIASTKYRCKTCQRFYLGKAKMKKHLKLNPDHKVPKKYESDNQLWLDLLERTYNAPKSEQVKVFVGELTNIMEKVKNLVPKGLKPLLNEKNPNSFKIDSTLSTLLGVSEGKYILDIDVLNGPNQSSHQDRIPTDLSILGSVNSSVIDTSLDEKTMISNESAVQASLLNLLDTGQVHFDNESSNTSEAVRCVDQLVNERLKILTDIVELNPQNIISSSLSPPNITLDLSMDMFPYTS